MSQDEKQYHENNSQRNSPPTIDTGNVKSPEGVNNSKESHNITNKPKAKPPIFKRVIIFFGNKNNQTKVANLISAGMLVATIILAYYTWRVFNQTTVQTALSIKAVEAAKISADAAKRSTDLQKQYLDSQIVAKKQSDLTDKRKEDRDTATFGLQKRNVQAQITSLKETQKEFEIENKPFIQIVNVRFDTLMPNKRVRIKFEFINYGKQPAKLTTNKMSLVFSEKDDFNDFTVIKKWIYQKYNSYLTGAFMLPDEVSTNGNISNEQLNLIKNNTVKLYVVGMFDFENTVTFKKSTYVYNRRLQFLNGNIDIQSIKDTTVARKPSVKKN